MSDPAKSAREIEDVLASIRRLVSESHVAPAAEPPTAPSAQPAPRLVLTPALRVADPDDPWAPVPAPVPEGSADAHTAMPEEEDPSWGLEDRLSDWGEIEDSAEEAVADAIAEQSADPEAPPQPDILAALEQKADGDRAVDPAAEFEPETGDADWPDRSAGRALHDLVLVRGQGGETAEADLPAPDAALQVKPGAHTGPEVISDREAVETMTDSEAPSSMTEDQTAEAADAVPRPGFTPVFSRRIDVRRPEMGQPLDAEVEDDRHPSDNDSGDAHVEDLGEVGQPFTFPETEDGLLDEETLRDIIAEVVREELQGALGQRITRNVRKMVRREIRLALAAEEFE
ncbi:hypothetical protein [Roseicyclus mahoneyensis]|uniref:Uncharacterized protein n=1 Tax=Roseicyclus mahoneyensis TaxID=164332 RepID=A0A316G5T4_9RHOB|nr:hypothetical protein [Roseicyclus mahoneyensis]PWK55316.1 hypothetical protein C7455_1186 [Roseicyclus mahoneyensis]